MPVFVWADAYSDKVITDKPVLYWRFSETSGSNVKPTAGNLAGEIVGRVKLNAGGPRARIFPDFDSSNSALSLSGGGNFIRIKDPGDMSVLDFHNGDSITLEAWVNPSGLPSGYSYIIGKGRTGNLGFPANNQNYSLRLANTSGKAGITFLFRDARNGTDDHWHRWTSVSGFTVASGWHHVAVSYTFGKPNSLRGYIDGQLTDGKWDKGGKTEQAPLVDNDEVWIGAALGGQAASAFQGGIDEVAIYRHIVSAERMAKRFKMVRPKFILNSADVPVDHVQIDLHENVGENWNYTANECETTFNELAFAIPHLPTKYNHKGLITDRSDTFLLRAFAKVKLPGGKHRLLLRSRTLSRLQVDGKIIANLKKAPSGTNAHGKVSAAPKDLGKDVRLLRPGMQEVVVEFQSTGKTHIFVLESFVGGKGKLRPETGDLSLSISINGAPFALLSPRENLPLTDIGWNKYATVSRDRLRLLNRKARADRGAKETKRWEKHHKILREIAANQPAIDIPEPAEGYPARNSIDHFINAKLHKAGRRPLPLTEDWAFLRRVSLDANGVVPSLEVIEEFEKDKGNDRRARAINRLLKKNVAWADHWTSYWQDVLAENPNIVKPKLNNTGPFRFWIHESLQDNKPMDRFATELVMMEGSRYYGGPAGFGIATQNDVPMAAKAQILGQAFLGMQMKCARCHDAPFHSFDQKDLFSMAAMLERKPIAVPSSSTVPEIVGRKARIEISLKPGASITPDWPFQSARLSEPVPSDSRAQLAAFITGGHGDRFAKVLVNRVWQRYFGWGLVEPADDWEEAKASHPTLLDWLGHEFILSGFDLKHIARLIMNSHAYQRQVDTNFTAANDAAKRLFAGPARRRMTAEQLVDSLFTVSGKQMDTEPLTLDINGRGSVNVFMNLGSPRRAWEFASLSNERDRPSLAIPKVQSVVNILSAFGWRDARQDALTTRDHKSNILQSAIVSNGIIGKRITQLSDDSAFTELALKPLKCGVLVASIYKRVLSRSPTKQEQLMMYDQLCAAYASRVVKGAKIYSVHEEILDVSWNNHLSEEANRIKIQLERLAREGDPPTRRLRAEWRERMEDVIFALVNSPEFIFIP